MDDFHEDKMSISDAYYYLSFTYLEFKNRCRVHNILLQAGTLLSDTIGKRCYWCKKYKTKVTVGDGRLLTIFMVLMDLDKISSDSLF